MASAINFSVGADNSPFIAVMRNTEGLARRTALTVNRNLGGMQKGFSSAVKWAAGLTAALGLSAAALKGLQGINAAFDDGGALADLSARTGIAVKDLVVLRQAFKNNGLEAQKIGPSINRLQNLIQAAADGSKPAQKIFTDLGLDWKALGQQAPIDQFQAVQGAIAGYTSDAARSLAVTKLFGKAGGDMLTLFRDSKAFSDARVQVGGLAAQMDKDSGKFDAISDKIGGLGLKSQQFFAGLAGVLADPVLGSLEDVEKTDLTGMGKQAGEAILKLVQIALNGWAKVQKGALLFQAAVLVIGAQAMEIFNRAWDISRRIADVISAIGGYLSAGANSFAATMADAIANIAINIRSSVQYAIEKAVEAAAKNPVINKLLGLGSFTANSFESIKDSNSQDTGWTKALTDFAAARRADAEKSGAAADRSMAAARGNKSPFFSNEMIQGFTDQAAAYATRAGAIKPVDLSAIKPKGNYAAPTDAQLRQQSGISPGYFAQLTGMYGGEKSAMAELRKAGMIRDTVAPTAAAATSKPAFETFTAEYVGVAEQQTKKLDDILGLMETAWGS